MKKLFTLFATLFLFASTHAQYIYFKGMLQSTQEVPINNSAATGVVIVKYDTATNILMLMGNFTALTDDVTAAHIHAPAAPGENAGVLIPLTVSTIGTATTGALSVTDTITEDQEMNLRDGMMYVNVHSLNYPGGEIRAQLTAATTGQSTFFSARLQGAQQVPPNGSSATGSAYVLVDEGVDSVFLTGSFSGLSSTATMAHIHNSGMPGENGPVMTPLVVTLNTSGTIHASDPITEENIAQMMNGSTYVNIHNAIYPGGEIRGQLTRLSETYFLKANLQGSQQVPPNGSAASGAVIVKYNTVTNELQLTGSYQNLSSAATASHIHAPAAPGSNAGVMVPIDNTGGNSGTLTLTEILSEEDEMDLLAGLSYVNVHTAEFPDGEIRGQLTTITGEAFYFTGNLNGTQQVPTNTSGATGSVTVLLDLTTDSVFVAGSFTGLTSAATAGHIHRGVAGENGPVELPLVVTNALDGTLSAAGMVSGAMADSMVLGFSYVNIHNAIYPGGEIRAQLGNLVLPVKLAYFNGYREGSGVKLIWKTSEESNVRQFDIQQQTATGTWATKTSVTAKGGAGSNQYAVTDMPTASKNGVWLYRLQMVDKDGRISYSPAISIVANGSKPALSILPNPVVNGVLQYSITGLAADARATVRIIDFTGRTVATATVSTLQNNRMYLSQLPSGLYKMVVNLNGTVLQKTFSKQ